jgi:glutaredoxin 3
MDSMSAQFFMYTTTAFRCPYCVRAKTTLTELGYTFDERDVSNRDIMLELQLRRPGVKTIPQIFLANGEYIGGCDDLLDLIMEDKLAAMIANMETA